MSYTIAFLDVWSPGVRSEVQRVAPPGFNLLFADSYESDHQRALASDADFVVPGFATIDAALLESAPRLQLVHKWGIGIDAIDLDELRKRGVGLAITSGGNAGPVAELALALMLAVYRRIPYVQRTLQEGRWVTAEMREICFQVSGKVIGLVGFGHIARALARRLAGFDVRIVYFDLQPAEAEVQTALGAEYLPMDELLAVSDIVSLHMPLTDQTRHLVDAAFLEKMKDGAVLINTARGGIVDDDALVRALESGKLLGAGLDAFEQEPPPVGYPLLAFDQVVATPHIGGGVFDNVASVARHVFANIQRHLAGEPIPRQDSIVAARVGVHEATGAR